MGDVPVDDRFPIATIPSLITTNFEMNSQCRLNRLLTLLSYIHYRIDAEMSSRLLQIYRISHIDMLTMRTSGTLRSFMEMLQPAKINEYTYVVRRTY